MPDACEWISTAEAARLLDVSVQAINKRAKRESWRSRPRKARGGGCEYHIDSLPPAARAELQRRAAEATPAGRAGRQAARKERLKEVIDEHARAAAVQAGTARAATLTGNAEVRMSARLAAVSAVAACLREHDVSYCIAAYNTGALDVAEDTRAALPTLSPASFYRWQKALQTAGAARLAGNYGTRRGQTLIDTQPELREFVLAMLVEHPHARAEAVLDGARARFAGSTLKMPSTRTVRRWAESWRAANPALASAVSSPDDFKNRYMTAYGSASADITELNQLWEMDSTPGDLLLRGGRHTLVGCIDVYSRRLKIHVSKTSTAAAVTHVLRACIADWGLPTQVKTDNGSDYVGQHLRRAFRMLQIDHQTCAPFSPWQKPHIESALGTLSHDLVELLPSYIGHSVAERSAIESRRAFSERLFKKDQTVELPLSREELQDVLDRWCDSLYHHAPHRGLDGKTPLQRVAEWTGTVRRITNERALDVLLQRAATRRGGYARVMKTGLKIDHGQYIAPELALWAGRDVLCLEDPEDWGAVYVFGEGEQGDLQFVCIAEDVARLGSRRAEIAAKARELQKARLQEQKAALKATAKEQGTKDIYREILDHAGQQAAAVHVLPRRAENATTPGLDAAAQALDARSERPALVGNEVFGEVVDWQAKAAAARAKAEAEKAAAQTSRETPDFDSPRQRAHWIYLQAFERELTGEERGYLDLYVREFSKDRGRGLDQLLLDRYGQKFRDLKTLLGMALMAK